MKALMGIMEYFNKPYMFNQEILKDYNLKVV